LGACSEGVVVDDDDNDDDNDEAVFGNVDRADAARGTETADEARSSLISAVVVIVVFAPEDEYVLRIGTEVIDCCEEDVAWWCCDSSKDDV